MGPSGFILDFLVPGVVALVAGVVLANELELRLDEELSNAAATIVVSAVLVGAYLVGIALRHSMRHLQYREPRIWHHRFMDRWPDEIESLKARWIHDSDDLGEVGSRLSTAEADELVGRLSEYYLSTSGEVWGDQLQYNRNVARVSSNTLYPLLVLAVMLSVSASKRAFEADFRPMGAYVFAALLSIVVGLGLREAHQKRMEWTVDKLVRTDVAHRLATERTGSS